MAHLLLSRLPHQLLATLMLVGVALNGANVIGRYFFGAPIFWAEEVMVYLMIWGVFIGLVAVTYEGQHISMDLLVDRLPARWLATREVVMTLVLAATAVYVAAQSWQIVRMFADTGAVSASAGVPKALSHAGLLLGFALAAVAAFVRLWQARVAAAHGELPEAQLP